MQCRRIGSPVRCWSHQVSEMLLLNPNEPQYPSSLFTPARCTTLVRAILSFCLQPFCLPAPAAAPDLEQPRCSHPPHHRDVPKRGLDPVCPGGDHCLVLLPDRIAQSTIPGCSLLAVGACKPGLLCYSLQQVAHAPTCPFQI